MRALTSSAVMLVRLLVALATAPALALGVPSANPTRDAVIADGPSIAGSATEVKSSTARAVRGFRTLNPFGDSLPPPDSAAAAPPDWSVSQTGDRPASRRPVSLWVHVP
jgi:hypothetical protein